MRVCRVADLEYLIQGNAGLTAASKMMKATALMMILPTRLALPMMMLPTCLAFPMRVVRNGPLQIDPTVRLSRSPKT